jgi:hypothetical protein
MDKSLIILALETLSEQVSDGTDWGCYESSFEGQERLDRIDMQIELMKTSYVSGPDACKERTINEYRQVKTYGYTQKKD